MHVVKIEIKHLKIEPGVRFYDGVPKIDPVLGIILDPKKFKKAKIDAFGNINAEI